MKVNIAKWPKRAVAAILAVLLAITFLPFSNFNLVTAKAAAGEEPAHDKVLTVNDDGTYTIALNVTGDSEKNPQKVNVIVIVDRSNSMDTQSGTGAYVSSNGTTATMYGLIDGEYVPLTRNYVAGQGWVYSYGGQRYTGQRYIYDATATRMQATRAAVDGLASTLLSYNGRDGNPNDTVEMALVDFATTARTLVEETTDATTFTNAVNGISPPGGNAGGTNWEMALRQADTISFGDNDPTYVIFFSDGAPTFYGTGPSGSGAEQEPNMSNSYNASTDEAAALATKVGKDHFYTIFAYGSNAGQTYMTNLTDAAGAPAGNNYSAANTVELEEAFGAILSAIELAGIGNVDITDGTTSKVTTSSGTAHLLDVDTTSYKYYRAGGIYDSTANGGLGEEWDGAPEATFVDGAVKWDLGDNFILENDVTYTVTFDCWPSQETLDHVASIKNDPTYYDKLDPAIKQYLDSSGNLKTNTTASMHYTDTRTGQSGSPTYDNPPPVTTSAVEQLAVAKDWHNELEDEWDKPEEIVLDVTRDGKNTYTATLNDDNEWRDSVYISIGIMRTSGEGEDEEIELLTTGHNFTFDEPGAAAGYKWELNVPVVRPMKINGTDTYLILVDENHPAPSGAKTYTLPDKDGVAGGTYYVSDVEEAGLTAVNERRASLNIRKVVDGDDAPADAVFPFTLHVNNSLAPATAPSEEDDPGHDSDYWIWISVRDKEGNRINEGVGGATSAGNGWWYAPNDTDVTIPVKAGYSIRVNNLPTGTTYKITEGTLPQAFTFDNAAIAFTEGLRPDTAWEFTGGQTSTGSIDTTNAVYTVTYTNKYELVDINVDKVWDDDSNAAGARPDELTLTLNGVPSGTTTPTPTITKDGDKWSYVWAGLPKYDSEGKKIEYTVTEETVPAGYTVNGSPASDGGTITNKYVVVDVSATKAWDDADNQDGIRPDSLTLTVNNIPSGFPAPTPTITKTGNTWTYKWTGLPKYDSSGTEIVYTVTEGTVPTGYTCETTTVANGGTITNVHAPTNIDVSVEKVWEDDDDRDRVRPDSVTVNLLADGVKKDSQVLSDDNEWEYTWTGLPGMADGEDIVYTITEDTVQNYSTVITGPDNKNHFVVTNSYTPEQTSVTATKVWDDNSDQDGIRPASVEFVLYKNGAATEKKITLDGTVDEEGELQAWTATFSGLPKNEAGAAITYSVQETRTDVITGIDGPGTYADSVAVDEESGLITITNKHTPEVTAVTVNKVWDDNNNQLGLRPSTLNVALYQDGQIYETYTLTATEEWTKTVGNLPKYKKDTEKGQSTLIEYYWTETVPAGYKKSGESTEDAVTTFTNTPNLGDLIIEKDLTKYNNFVNQTVTAEADPVTFIYRVTATLGSWTYDDYFSLTFDAAGSDSIEFEEAFPVGAEVTIVEVYSGAGYTNTGQSTVKVTIADPADTTAEVATANFANAYDNKIKNGYGIENTYVGGQHINTLLR